MAQVKGGRSRLAGRLGAGRAGSVVAAVLALAVLGAGVSAATQRGGSGGFEIERSSGEAGDPDEPAKAGETDDETSDEPARLTVHVDGAVAAPGVYELVGEGLRLNDAVEAAGGLVEDADTSQVNLAAELADGQKVHVPLKAEGPGEAVVDGTATGRAATSSGTGLVNLNTATAAELQGLPGIGEATARAIIEDRERNGPFTSAEDLMRVSGIGEKKFQKLSERVYV